MTTGQDPMAARDWFELGKDPPRTARQLDLPQLVEVAWHLLYDAYEQVQHHRAGVALLEAARREHAQQWRADPRHDILLGDGYELLGEHAAMTAAWNRGVETADTVLPELWVRLARSYFSPGSAGVSEERARELLRQAQAVRPTEEAARLLGQLLRLEGDHAARATLAEADRLAAAGQHLRPQRPPGAPGPPE